MVTLQSSFSTQNTDWTKPALVFLLGTWTLIGKSWIEFKARSKKCEVASYQVTQCSSTWVNPRWCQHVILMEVILYHLNIYTSAIVHPDLNYLSQLLLYIGEKKASEEWFWSLFFCFAGWTQVWFDDRIFQDSNNRSQQKIFPQEWLFWQMCVFFFRIPTWKDVVLARWFCQMCLWMF